MSLLDLAERDVVLVTLDSCRYDTAARASLPNLSALGPLLRAETPGTYTLPAHAALFNGMLPRPVSAQLTVAGVGMEAIWRCAAARPSHGSVEVIFSAPTLMEHYANRGFRVFGAGGVTFFDPTNANNGLPKLFPEFRYFGRPAGSAADTASRVVDREASLTLAHVDEITDLCCEADRFFCFINCPSTHIPYTSPNSRLSEETTDLLQRLYRLHDTQTPEQAATLSPTQTATLWDMQRHALEWADTQLGRLFVRLAHRHPLVVICGDHGEEFGEGGRYGHGHPHPSVTTVPLWSGLLPP